MAYEAREKVRGLIGQVIANSSVKDLVEALTWIGVAYVSYRNKYIKNPIFGLVALKLATTPSTGVTSPSQLAGLAMLAYLGLAWRTGEGGKAFYEDVAKQHEKPAKVSEEDYKLAFDQCMIQLAQSGAAYSPEEYKACIKQRLQMMGYEEEDLK